MRKTIFTLAICVISTINAQEFKIYNMNNGVKDIFASTVVKHENNVINIYKTDNGIKNMLPSMVIKQENNQIKIYGVNNGIREMLPSQVIIPSTNNFCKPTTPAPIQHHVPANQYTNFNARATSESFNQFITNSTLKFN